MSARRVCSSIVVLGSLLCSVPAQAQTAPPPPNGGEPVEAVPPSAPSPAPNQYAAPPAPASAVVGVPVNPLKIETPYASIRFGLLLQPQWEAIGSPVADGVTENIYLRRTRVIIGGTLFKNFEYFFDTDYPNLFKSATENGATTKNSPGLNIQDAFATWKPFQFFKVDGGFMLPPLAHNAVQGATTLYAWDYFANSFHGTGAFGNAAPDPIGRDLGVQLRGLLLGDHLEYRVGMFQGVRENIQPAPMPPNGQAEQVAGRNFFRVAARLQLNVLDAEPGFFYAGTYLGSKHILSFGGSYDFQDSYKYWGVDGFLDMPAGPGVITAQVNVAHWDHGNFIPAATLHSQTSYMGEVGYLIAPIALSPIVRYEQNHVFNGEGPNETRYVGGLAYWPFGHNVNVKAFYSRISQSNGIHDYDRFNLQVQLFFY
jgi:hypothetical protein